MAIIVITLASRAAIRGGLNPELAFTMADNYICEIENYVDERIIRKKLVNMKKNLHDKYLY